MQNRNIQRNILFKFIAISEISFIIFFFVVVVGRRWLSTYGNVAPQIGVLKYGRISLLKILASYGVIFKSDILP